MWVGKDGKPSIRRVFAIALIIDFINNTNYAIHKWEVGKSYADVAMLLGIEAGLVAALLTNRSRTCCCIVNSHYILRNN